MKKERLNKCVKRGRERDNNYTLMINKNEKLGGPKYMFYSKCRNIPSLSMFMFHWHVQIGHLGNCQAFVTL